MRKFIFSTIAFLFIGASVFAQTGKMFPEVPGKTLSDKAMSIPKNTKGKVTLIGVAYSKKSDDLLKKWFNPIYNTFVNPPTWIQVFIFDAM